jgi:hypothetical protein
LTIQYASALVPTDARQLEFYRLSLLSLRTERLDK